jgi:signal transduction histidine kinase
MRRSDIRLAAMAAAIQIAGTVGANNHLKHVGHHACWWASSCGTSTHLNAGAFVLLSVGPIALLFKRFYPRTVLLVAFAATAVYVGIGYVEGPNFAALAVAFVWAMISGDRLAALATLIGGWAVFLWLPAALGHTSRPTLLAALSVTAWLLVLLAGSQGVRYRRERFVEARRAREREAKLQADEERLRIARELHDVLAHNISLINVQSGVALHLLDEQPEQARTALAAINEASADALQEVRSVLDALRGTRERPPREPTAGLARIEELVSHTTAAGVHVELKIAGEQRPLPASVDLAAYRIVQEALTNVVRHAGAGNASVQLSYRNGNLTVQIDDDGHGVDGETGPGNGIAGMRERAAALGGEFDAGPRPEGGFRVRARLPIGDRR